MDEKKQIEEMATVMVERALREYPSTQTGIDSKVCRNRFADIMQGYAKDLYNAGYCKASEFIWEIFDKVDEIAYRYLNDTDYSAGDMIYDLNELKKEYTEGIYAKKANRNL